MKRLFVTKKSGKVEAVIISKKEYDKITALIDEFEDVKTFDTASNKIRKGEEQFVSFAEILKEVNR